MQTGYYNHGGGAYLPTSPDSSIRSSPAVYLPNETQISMVAAQPPGEQRIAYDPAWYWQVYAQSQDFQDGRNYGIFANANSIRQFADSSGQQKDSSKRYVCEPLRSSSELSNNTGLSCQLSTDEALAVEEHETYADLIKYYQGLVACYRKDPNGGLALSSKGSPNDCDSPLQSYWNIPKSNSVACHPTSSTCDEEDVERPSLNRAVVEHCTVTTGQALEKDRSRGCKANAELTPKSKETSESSASERLLTGTLTSDVENTKHAEFDLQVKKHSDISDDGKPVCSDDCEVKTFVSNSDESFRSKWCNRYILNEITALQYSITALKELIASLENVTTIAKIDNFSEVMLQQYWNGDIGNVHIFTSTEYPHIMYEAAATCRKTDEESPVVLTALSGVTSGELTEKYPGVILSCSTSQEESMPVSVNADKDYRVPAVSSPLINITHKDKGDKGLKPVEVDNVQGMINDSKDSLTPRIIGDQDANINKQKYIGNQQHSPVTLKEGAAHSNSSVDKIQTDAQSVTTNQSEQSVYDQTSCKGTRKDASYACSRVDLSISFPDNKIAQLSSPPGRVDEDNPSVTVLNDFQFEDISDAEDMSKLDMKLPEHEESHFSFHFEDPVYEDISEDESPQNQNTVVEMPSLSPDVSEPSVEPHGHVQVQMKSVVDEELIPMKQMTPETEMPSIEQHCSCPHFDKTDDTECVPCDQCNHARHNEWQTNRSCSPSSDLEYEDETDDEMDDDWDVLPLIISELKLELPEDEADSEDLQSHVGEDEDEVTQGSMSPTLCELLQPPPVQVPASVFSEIEVFDTCESFKQAKGVQFGKFPQFLSEESLPERDPKSHHSRRDSYSEAEDSCDTDDSCNYSPVEERNHLTVSKKLLNCQSASASPETNDSESETENVDDEATDLQNEQTGSRQNSCEKEDIIILNSDTEDECEQICANNAKTQKRVSLENEKRKRHSSETVISKLKSIKEKLLKKGLLSAYSSRRAENSGQLCATIARSEHVQHEATQQSASNDESVIIIDSDTDDESTQNYKRAKRKRESPSGWASDGNDAGDKQERTHVDTEYETDQKKLQECKPSADSSKPRHGSKPRDTHSEKEMQDTRSDLSHCIKTGPLPEPTTDSVRVKQKMNTRMTSKRFHESDHVVSADNIPKKKAKMKSSETEDSDSAFGNENKSSHVSNKPQRTCQSSKDSSKKQPQSGTDKEADSTVSCNPVIPRLLVKSHPQPSGRLKLSKQSIAQEEAPKKPKSTSKTVQFSKTETPLLHGDTQGKSASNPKPASGRQHVTPLSKSNESSSSPRNISSSIRKQQQRSFPLPSSLLRPSALELVKKQWQASYHATRKDKKPSVGTEEGLRRKNSHDYVKEAKPRRPSSDKAPRQRQSSQESATPLMKKTMDEARELTKARNRDASGEPTGRHVGDGYKWNK